MISHSEKFRRSAFLICVEDDKQCEHVLFNQFHQVSRFLITLGLLDEAGVCILSSDWQKVGCPNARKHADGDKLHNTTMCQQNQQKTLRPAENMPGSW